MRILQSGRKVREEKAAIDMTIKSKCPAKWLFVDLETGEVWHWNQGNMPFMFRSASSLERRELRELRYY